ncbi:MAG: hypothetical protein ABIE70_00020 [bacterium]
MLPSSAETIITDIVVAAMAATNVLIDSLLMIEYFSDSEFFDILG